MNERKRLNKHYSSNIELLYKIDLTDDTLCEIIKDCIIVEPFAGNCDLIKHLQVDLTVLAENNFIKQILLTDITKITNSVSIPGVKINYNRADTLLNNPFKNIRSKVFVITNPPYTAKNKLSPELKKKYSSILDSDTQDLYQIFIKQMIENESKINGGLIIIPVNFLLGKQSRNLRDTFLNYFNIFHLNIFEKKMFEYTTQSTITLVFTHKRFNIKRYKTYLHTEKSVEVISKKAFEYVLGFSFQKYFALKDTNATIIRVCRNCNITDPFKISNIRISLIDPKIYAYMDKSNKNTEDKVSDRSSMRVCFTKRFSSTQEEIICGLFNKHLQKIRTLTHSLVITSFREKSRKRLTFEDAYSILEFIVNTEI